jgi:6-phosphogluconolactonase
MVSMPRIHLLARLALPLTLLLPLAAAPKNYLVFVGTGTGTGSKGIYTFRFNPASGQAGPLALAAEAPNPSFLAVHPNGKYVYAVSEINDFNGKRTGAVAAYRINAAAGTLTLINRVSSGGAGPCHVNFDRKGRFVLVANYSGGSSASIPILAGGKLGEPASIVQHHGSSVNPKRQEGPHAHGILASPDNRFVLVPDLGQDQVIIYAFDPAKGTLTPHGAGKVPPGAGSRHVAFHPNGKFLYTINEMGSSVTTFAWDAAKGTLTPVETVSTLPKDYSGDTTCAEVQTHPNGKFLYGSNRGHDSIAVFHIDPAKFTLSPTQFEPVGGKTPRHFTLDPTSAYLFSANQDTDNIIVFKVDPATGKLAPAGVGLKAPRPMCIDFLELK